MLNINILQLLIKSEQVLKNEGITSFSRKSFNYIRNMSHWQENGDISNVMDVLFINGCDASVPHPARYRVAHQKEQLIANHIISDEVYYLDLKPEMVYRYRFFIFFRCPVTDVIASFIQEAKQLHKRCYFDIDDLVINTQYTDMIPYVQSLGTEEKELYNDGVNRMGKTLSLCDGAITTTKVLAKELSLFTNDVFINRNVASEQMLFLSEAAIKDKNNIEKDRNTVVLGYFSGSITHNDDFLMIEPVIKKLLNEFPFLKLHLVGLLGVPDTFCDYKKQLILTPFVDWQMLPQLISSVDVNLAPLTDSIFNEAKSENKWVEAALVKVPTVASNIGAFAEMIADNKTGLLCSTIQEWYTKLKQIICDTALRARIGKTAHDFVLSNNVTMYTGFPLARFIKERLTKNIVFVLPSLNISGGVLVVLKHAAMLQMQGFDVSVISEHIIPFNQRPIFLSFDNARIPVYYKDSNRILCSFCKCIATLWATLDFVESYTNISERYYLVQNFETDFYSAPSIFRIRANQSYQPVANVKFITISKWCQAWLKDKFDKASVYAPNGIDLKTFFAVPRDFSGKIRIIIEGDPASEYKNVDESFEITNRLPKDKFEVWFMSYNAEPKPWYHVDRFLHKIPHQEVGNIYRSCHILLKTSILESFSYPPLEMMATGGFVVVRPNEGNAEYIRSEENCLTYDPACLDSALKAIYRICEEPFLREHLIKVGLETAKARSWENIKDEILALYE